MKFLFTLFIFLLCTAVLPAFGGRERVETVRVTGVVRLVGTSLFPEIVITDDDTDWHVTSDEIDKLHNLQHRTVTVEGEVTAIELTFANGLPAGTRKELKNIRIINVQQ